MKLLFSSLPYLATQVRVKYISLSIIGISAVSGITYEELSEAKISNLISQLGSLIPTEDWAGGGRK